MADIPISLTNLGLPATAPLVGIGPVVLDADFEFPCREIHVTGNGGNISIVRLDGVTVVYPAESKQIIVMYAKRINASGTTATGLFYGW